MFNPSFLEFVFLLLIPFFHWALQLDFCLPWKLVYTTAAAKENYEQSKKVLTEQSELSSKQEPYIAE